MKLLFRLLFIAIPAGTWTMPMGAAGVEPSGNPPRVTVSLLLLHTPSGVQTTTDLASLGAVISHQSQLIPGSTVFLEPWCQTPGPNGISTAVLDLTYSTTFFDTSVAQVVLAPQWDLLPYEVFVDDGAGRVDDFGGNNFTGLGVAPEWAKIGAVEFNVTNAPAGPVVFCSEYAGGFLKFAIRSEGAVDPDDVAYGCFMVGCGVDAHCDDGDACTDDTCDPDVGCLHNPTNCNNGLHCDGVETCDSDLGCQPGTPPDCNDGIDCTDDSCDEVNDQCVNTPDDGLCDDGAFCNGAETCDPVQDCQAGTPPDLDDGVGCTVDTCDEANDLVVHTPDDGLCDDGAFCNGDETCDPVQDCQAGTPPELDDGVSCTVDTCDEANDLVVHTPDDGLCDDGAFCNGAETCDPVQDCQAGTPPDLDDGVSCTVDTCDEANDLVVHTPDDGLCDDGAFCNGDETCDVELDCQPGSNPCTDPSLPFCDEDIDACVECLEIGDIDGDGDVDLQDFATFHECETGPLGPVDPPAYPPGCRCFDGDDDGDVDLADFAMLQENFTGELSP
ncbi:MAG: hypothetical protein V3W34_18670 [Phycisphaerae bacterium]